MEKTKRRGQRPKSRGAGLFNRFAMKYGISSTGFYGCGEVEDGDMDARVRATPFVVTLDAHTPTLKLLRSWSAPKRGAARAGVVSTCV